MILGNPNGRHAGCVVGRRSNQRESSIALFMTRDGKRESPGKRINILSSTWNIMGMTRFIIWVISTHLYYPTYHTLPYQLPPLSYLSPTYQVYSHLPTLSISYFYTLPLIIPLPSPIVFTLFIHFSSSPLITP